MTYTIEKNLDKIEEWANRLKRGQLRLDADGAEDRRPSSASSRSA